MPEDNSHDSRALPSGASAHRLSDGREELAAEAAHPLDPDARRLGQDFAGRNSNEDTLPRRLGETFADTSYGERQHLGDSFADPNSIDDTKLGRSFTETNASPNRHRRHQAKEAAKAAAKRPSGFNRNLAFFIAAVIILFAIVFVVGVLPRLGRTHEIDQKAQTEQTQEPEVVVSQVKAEESGAGLIIPGTATPLTEAYVYARANGYLRTRFVDIGDHVVKGQLLATIDAPDLDQQVDQAREQLRQAEAQKVQAETQLALTRVTVERYRVLVAKGVFSQQDGDQREADYANQVANVAQAERNVQAYEANLRRQIALQGYERVTSPFTGTITQRNVDVGALISASGSGGSSSTSAPPSQASGQTQAASANSNGTSGAGTSLASPTGTGAQGGPLFGVAQTERLRVLVSVPEGYASSISTGQKAQLHFDVFPGQSFSGAVTRTAGTIDQNTRTLLTEVQVPNPTGKLLAGMYTVVTFAPIPVERGKVSSTMVIPGDSLAVRLDKEVVALVQNGTIHLTPVQIGRDFGSTVEILSGLKPGDLIASNVTDDITEGRKVKIKPSSTPAPKTADQSAPPGGNTQYGNQSISDQDNGGQVDPNKKTSQKESGKSKTESKP